MNEVVMMDDVVVDEKELEESVSTCERMAAELQVLSDEDYAMAGELVKQVKTLQKKADEYWEPMRESAYDAYQAVLNHKKDMVDPMKNAEKIIKNKMSYYAAEKERKRREAEAELRRKAQEEADRKLAEAVEAEKNGDAESVAYAMEEAEAADGFAQTATVVKQDVKTRGVYTAKTWKITGIDADKVPVNFGGVEIRPVDEKAVMRLIKAAKGNIDIPGVTFEEVQDIRVRA